MRFLISFLVFFVSTFAHSAEVFYFYDSSKHKKPNQSLIFSSSFDVSLPSKIESQINKRLYFDRNRNWTEEQLERAARQRLKNDPELISLMKMLDSSYRFLKPAYKFNVQKIPAIVLSENGHNWTVYGETNLQKALVVIRNSAEYKRVMSNKP